MTAVLRTEHGAAESAAERAGYLECAGGGLCAGCVRKCGGEGGCWIGVDVVSRHLYVFVCVLGGKLEWRVG